MTGCRIGNVKLKAGGSIYRLPALDRDEVQNTFVKRASMISGFYKPGEIVGFALMAWSRDGHHSVGYYVQENSIVGMTMVPSYVSDAIRRRMLEDGDWETP